MAEGPANAAQPQSQAASLLAALDLLERINLKLDRILEQAAAGDPRFLTVADAARYAGLSEVSIRRMLKGGKLTGLRPVPGRVVIDRRQLDSVVLSSVRQLRKGRGIRDKAARPGKDDAAR